MVICGPGDALGEGGVYAWRRADRQVTRADGFGTNEEQVLSRTILHENSQSLCGLPTSVRGDGRDPSTKTSTNERKLRRPACARGVPTHPDLPTSSLVNELSDVTLFFVAGLRSETGLA